MSRAWFIIFIVFFENYANGSTDISGILVANDVTILTTDTTSPVPFYYHAGDNVQFSCRKTGGGSNVHTLLLFSDKMQTNNSMSVSRRLTVAHNGLTATCHFYDQETRASVSADLKTELLSGGRVIGSVWLYVLCAMLLLLILAAAVWLWASYRNRQYDSGTMNVAYAERNSVENLDPRASARGDKQTNNQTDKQTEPNNKQTAVIVTERSKSDRKHGKKSDPTYIRESDPTYGQIDVPDSAQSNVPYTAQSDVPYTAKSDVPYNGQSDVTCNEQSEPISAQIQKSALYQALKNKDTFSNQSTLVIQ